MNSIQSKTIAIKLFLVFDTLMMKKTLFSIIASIGFNCDEMLIFEYVIFEYVMKSEGHVFQNIKLSC